MRQKFIFFNSFHIQMKKDKHSLILRFVTYLLKFGVFPFQLHQIFNPLFVVLMPHQFSILLRQLNILLAEHFILL